MAVFICGGRYDGIAPESNQRTMQQQIPNAQLELFEGGHLFFILYREVYGSHPESHAAQGEAEQALGYPCAHQEWKHAQHEPTPG